MNMFTLLAPFYDFLMTAMHKRQGSQLIDLTVIFLCNTKGLAVRVLLYP
jgi:hypothetical protein